MPGLLRGLVRTALVAGTATAIRIDGLGASGPACAFYRGWIAPP